MELVIKDSRKIFWWAYGGVAALIVLLIYRSFQGIPSGRSLVISAITILIGLSLPEIMRAWKVCKVSGHKIEVASGFIQRRHRSILSNTVAEIHVHQSPLQRIFNCGSISISPNTQQQEIHLGIFNDPRKAASDIENILGLHQPTQQKSSVLPSH